MELTFGKNTEIKYIENPLEFWTNTDEVNCAVNKNLPPMLAMIGIDLNINGDSLSGDLDNLVEYDKNNDRLQFRTSYYTTGETITVQFWVKTEYGEKKYFPIIITRA